MRSFFAFLNKVLVYTVLLISVFLLVSLLIFLLKPEMFFNMLYKYDTAVSDNTYFYTDEFQGTEIADSLENFNNSQQQNMVSTQVDINNSNSTKKSELHVNNVREIKVILNKSTPAIRLYKGFMFQQINAVLLIPDINIKGPIISGTNPHIMEQGFWHVNINGAWLGGGNVVIFGHRFYHIPPAKDTFFNLDKVKLGDTILIKTDIGTWYYEIYKKYITNAHDDTIFKNTKSPELTLVTCHPLWTSKQRLVVKAKLKNTLLIN